MPDDALIHATSYQHEIRRASEDSAALLFFFYVHRECFFNRTNTDAPCISSSDACLLWSWTHAQENLGDVEKDGDRKKKAEYSYRSLVAPTRQKQKEGVLVFA